MIIEIVGLFLAVLICYALFKIFKVTTHLIINSVAGFFFLLLLSVLGITIKITLFSILVIAICGIPGVLILLIFQFFGLI